MERMDFARLDDEAKWAAYRQWLQSLAGFAAGTYKEDRGDDKAIFSGKYLERPFRVVIDFHFARPRVELRIANERGDLYVRRATRPLDPLPESDPEWDDRPPTVRHFLTNDIYMEEPKDEMDEKVARLVGLLPGLILQILQTTGADEVGIDDDTIAIEYNTWPCEAPHMFAAQMQHSLDLANQLARELGA